MSQAYKLSHNLDHCTANQDYDVWHVFKDRKEKFDEKFLRLEPFDELPPHRFEGKIEKRLSWLDYPIADPDYPVMSRKMVDTLLSVGNFDCEVKPLTIYDWKTKERTTDDFVFLHLLEWKDIIDRENCICYPKTGGIKKLALKEPKGGYPPLFRVKDAGLKWFVSEEAKSALEEVDIKGVRFVPLIYPDSETTSKVEPTENLESSQSQATEKLLTFDRELWDVDRTSNLISLPSTQAQQSSIKIKHRDSHPNWSEHIAEVLKKTEDDLKARYTTLNHVPDDTLQQTIEQVESELREDLTELDEGIQEGWIKVKSDRTQKLSREDGAAIA